MWRSKDQHTNGIAKGRLAKEWLASALLWERSERPRRGTLEEFLFERYCLYTVHKGKLCIAHTQHDPWKYREGRVELTSNSLTESYDLGILDSLKPDLVHMSEGVLVNTWSAEEV